MFKLKFLLSFIGLLGFGWARGIPTLTSLMIVPDNTDFRTLISLMQRKLGITHQYYGIQSLGAMNFPALTSDDFVSACPHLIEPFVHYAAELYDHYRITFNRLSQEQKDLFLFQEGLLQNIRQLKRTKKHNTSITALNKIQEQYELFYNTIFNSKHIQQWLNTLVSDNNLSTDPLRTIFNLVSVAHFQPGSHRNYSGLYKIFLQRPSVLSPNNLYFQVQPHVKTQSAIIPITSELITFIIEAIPQQFFLENQDKFIFIKLPRDWYPMELRKIGVEQQPRLNSPPCLSIFDLLLNYSDLKSHHGIRMKNLIWFTKNYPQNFLNTAICFEPN